MICGAYIYRLPYELRNHNMNCHQCIVIQRIINEYQNINIIKENPKFAIAIFLEAHNIYIWYHKRYVETIYLSVTVLIANSLHAIIIRVVNSVIITQSIITNIKLGTLFMVIQICSDLLLKPGNISYGIVNDMSSQHIDIDFLSLNRIS